MTRFDETSARAALDALEKRLRGTHFEILDVARDADIPSACVAFAALAATYHPKRFTAVSRSQSTRAHMLYQKLRQALRDHVASQAGAQRVS